MVNSPRKAVALLSGGLDSMLAVRVVQEQGVHVEAINFFTGFCVDGFSAFFELSEKTCQRHRQRICQQLQGRPVATRS